MTTLLIFNILKLSKTLLIIIHITVVSRKKKNHRFFISFDCASWNINMIFIHNTIWLLQINISLNDIIKNAISFLLTFFLFLKKSIKELPTATYYFTWAVSRLWKFFISIEYRYMSIISLIIYILYNQW